MMFFLSAAVVLLNSPCFAAEWPNQNTSKFQLLGIEEHEFLNLPRRIPTKDEIIETYSRVTPTQFSEQKPVSLTDSSELEGEIVYLYWDKGLWNVYKISAKGSNKTLLFRNVSEPNLNSLSPRWSSDGKSILFGAMKNGNFVNFAMDEYGSNVKSTSQRYTWGEPSSLENLVIDPTGMYYKSEEGTAVLLYPINSLKVYDAVRVSKIMWSPDKKYVMFNPCISSKYDCRILIANKLGTKLMEIDKGYLPDWKY